MLVEPAQQVFGATFAAAAHQGQPVRLRAVHAEGRAITTSRPLGPYVAEDAFGEQAQLMRRNLIAQIEFHALRAEAWSAKRHTILDRWDVGVDGSAGRGGDNVDRVIGE